MKTIEEVISRVRNQVKGVKQDSFLTDRFLYSLIMKHAKLLMRRQDSTNKLMKFSSVFQELKFVELVEVDKTELECLCITTGCKVMRTKDKLPEMIEGYFGPLFRTISSLDRSVQVQPTFAAIFEKISKQKTFKYNKDKFYWYSDGYLYLPNVDWDAIKVEGLFEGDISKYNCDTEDDCKTIQQRQISVPEFLFSEIEQLVMRDLGIMIQIPTDAGHDMSSLTR
jgi:hypothetical protein